MCASGQKDMVRCFHCGIGLKDWSQDDEPLLEHVKHSPYCPFLKQLLGDQLLEQYRVGISQVIRFLETFRLSRGFAN